MIPYYTRLGQGPPLLLLHATLSSGRQLRGLASRLAGRHTVISVDRRGSGRSPVDGPAEPIDVAVHVADLVAIAERERLVRAAVAGHSYGGCVALELAAREPGLIGAVFAYEPPYGPLASAKAQAGMAQVAGHTLALRDDGDLPGAALAFMEGVAGAAAVASLSPAARERIGRAGQGAVADATLLGMDPLGLARIDCPVRVATGTASAALYAQIAAALVTRIDGAEHARLEGLDHMAPVLRPEAVAASIEELLER